MSKKKKGIIGIAIIMSIIVIVGIVYTIVVKDWENFFPLTFMSSLILLLVTDNEVEK